MVQIKITQICIHINNLKPSIEAYSRNDYIFYIENKKLQLQINSKQNKQETRFIMKELSEHSEDCSLMVHIIVIYSTEFFKNAVQFFQVCNGPLRNIWFNLFTRFEIKII